MILIPPHSVFSSPQFASFSLLISNTNNHKENVVKEITGDDGQTRGNSSSATRFRMCRGEPTILVASANAFLSEELCLACLDELHEFLANSRQNRWDGTHDTDGDVVVDWYRSRSIGLALCYMLIKRQELIQDCIPWLHPPNSTTVKNSNYSRMSSFSSSSSSQQLQGLVLCVGISGLNQFFSVFVNALPSRMHRTLSLLPSVFALPTAATGGGTANSKKEHIDVQTPLFGNSSSSLGKPQTRWMEALLSSLVEEEDYTNESLLVQHKRQPKDFVVSEKKGGVDTATNTTAIKCLVGADNNPITSSATTSTNRSRMEVEQMEIMGIHDTTMPKKSIISSIAQQQEYHSSKPQSNKRSTTISIPSLHGFDYIPPEVLPPITVLTTTSSTTIINHSSSYHYHNNNTKDVTTAKAQKSTWNQVSNGSKYPVANNSKISEDISSCNSTTSPASEITTPTTATTVIFHPTSSNSTTTLSNPLIEVEKANIQHKPQQNHLIHSHFNGRDSAEATTSMKEHTNPQLKASITTSSSTPTSSPSSSLQHYQEKGTVRKDMSEEITSKTAATSTFDSNDNVPKDRKIPPEDSRIDTAKYSFKITAETSIDTSITSNENSIPINSSTPIDTDSTTEENTLRKDVREDVVVSAAIPSSNELPSTASNEGLTTGSINNEEGEEASTAILPIDVNLGTLTLTVSVALNEDIICSFYNSKLLHCHVNGLIQVCSSVPSIGKPLKIYSYK